MTTATEKKESALGAIFREMNLPQLIMTVVALSAIVVPLMNSISADNQKDKVNDAKEKAVMQFQIAQINTRLDKSDQKTDTLASLVGTIVTNQAEGHSKLDSVAQAIELMRQDIQGLRSRVH